MAGAPPARAPARAGSAQRGAATASWPLPPARLPPAPRHRAAGRTRPTALPRQAAPSRSPSPQPQRSVAAVSIRPGETAEEAARRASGGSGGPGGEEPRDGEAEPALLMRLKAQAILERIDESGAWTVVSALLAFGTFLLETLNQDNFGGWDVLYRDDLPLTYGLSMNTISFAEGVTNVVFAVEYGVRAWIAGFSFTFFTSPFNLVDLASALPPVLALAGADGRTLRLLRVCRVLRLLRLLDRSPDSVLFGVLQSDDTGLQLVGVAAEFVCIFCCAAGVIYDLELGSNENVHNLSDTLYWAFLTLTGIGQPFEIVTPAGKVATVIAVLVALVVIPGQLAKLATVSMNNNLSVMEYMTDDEREEFIASGGKVAPRNAAAAAAANERARMAQRVSVGGAGAAVGNRMRAVAGSALAMPLGPMSAAPQMVQQQQQQQQASRADAAATEALAVAGGAMKLSPSRRFRRTLVTPRACRGCDLRIHDADAAFCKSCGAVLPPDEDEQQNGDDDFTPIK